MDSFVLRALAAGIGVALVAGPLGSLIVWRRMAFFGAALAHSAILGVALGLLLAINVTLAIFATSVVLALLLAALRRRRDIATDTLLSILAHGGLALGLVVIAFMDAVRIDLMSYLFGDLLAVSTTDLFVIFGGGAAALAIVAWLWRPLLSLTVHEDLARVEGEPGTALEIVFMLLVALTVAAAVKVVGVLLVVAILVTPPAAARRIARTPEQMAALASLIGCVSVLAGLGASLAWDTPSGPSIVIVSLLAFGAAMILPRRA